MFRQTDRQTDRHVPTTGRHDAPDVVADAGVIIVLHSQVVPHLMRNGGGYRTNQSTVILKENKTMVVFDHNVVHTSHLSRWLPTFKLYH